jgi:hypothetical protein
MATPTVNLPDRAPLSFHGNGIVPQRGIEFSGQRIVRVFVRLANTLGQGFDIASIATVSSIRNID